MNNKRYLKIALALILVFLSWYFFIKKSDYTINFKIKAATGTIFQGVNDWSKVRKSVNNENYRTISKNNFNLVSQELKVNNEIYTYDWTFTPENDSITQVTVSIIQKGKSLYNKLTAPFFPTKFKHDQVEKIKSFKEGLEQHLKNFKIKIDGDGKTEATFVAYIQLKSTLQEKAQTMIMNDSKLTAFLKDNNLKIVGKPYLEVENWDVEKEQLQFNYCFPIENNKSISTDSIVKFKTLKSQKGIQATYFGNYRTSDRAWFQIMDYAKKHQIQLNLKPIEHYFANPYNGGNELDWETKILIPYSK